MKLIYTQPTLSLIAQKEGVETANEIVAKGEIKQTEELITYLLIEDGEQDI